MSADLEFECFALLYRVWKRGGDILNIECGCCFYMEDIHSW
jgi:hypothetical protein